MRFGYQHYCLEHDEIVDAGHIDECDLIRPFEGKTSEIIKELEEVESIFDLPPPKLAKVSRDLGALYIKIKNLEQDKRFVLVQAFRKRLPLAQDEPQPNDDV
jgi:hypothetical protein